MQGKRGGKGREVGSYCWVRFDGSRWGMGPFLGAMKMGEMSLLSDLRSWEVGHEQRCTGDVEAVDVKHEFSYQS